MRDRAESDRRYGQSEKGRARALRYAKGDKRRATQARYDQTEAGQARKRRYEETRYDGLAYPKKLLENRRRAALKRIANRRAE